VHTINRIYLLFCLATFAQLTAAATATGTFSVTATVNSTCTVGTSNVAFGTYDPSSGSANNASGSVSVTCTTGSTYSIALDAGGNAGGASVFSNRRMKAGTSNYLPYQLYLDSGHATVWGDGTNSSSLNPASGTYTGNGSAQGYTVYGQLTAGQYVAPGSYTDTVNVTVTYN
jgi:spore coat protein U-like protein